MRKFVLAAVAMAFTIGFALAVPVTIVKVDGDKITVKEGKKGEETEKTYKLSDKTKFTEGDKDVDTTKGRARLEKMAGKGRADITVEGDNVTAVKFLAGKKKTEDKKSDK